MTPRRYRLAAAALASAAALACRRSAESLPAAEAAPPALTRPAPASPKESGYDLLPAEAKAVEAFLEANSDLRASSDEDRRPGGDEASLRALYGIYHPYFCRGDANDDGLLDFVLGFVRRDSEPDAPWFTVVLFSGRPDGKFEPGEPVERDVSLADGDLSIDRDAIVVTPDTADEVSRRYRWDPKRRRHVFVHDEPEEPATPPPAKI